MSPLDLLEVCFVGETTPHPFEGRKLATALAQMPPNVVLHLAEMVSASAYPSLDALEELDV